MPRIQHVTDIIRIRTYLIKTIAEKAREEKRSLTLEEEHETKEYENDIDRFSIYRCCGLRQLTNI